MDTNLVQEEFIPWSAHSDVLPGLETFYNFYMVLIRFKIYTLIYIRIIYALIYHPGSRSTVWSTYSKKMGGVSAIWADNFHLSHRIPLSFNFEYISAFELISHFNWYLKWYTVRTRPLSCCWLGCHNCAIIDKDEHTVSRPLQSIPIYGHQSSGTHMTNILLI